ncbi:MAG: nicotinate-nucleotide--dimethylbenzimidazole phosphoribosyltransferase [Coriobacteriales bacterium]|nr:nicotinate-nucleotide--dimethylbenzimidazole phosphoribosyltransferase [Coriobacteriales bacterium]
MREDYVSGLCIPSASEDAIRCARSRWDAIAKPIGSLGALEDMVVQVAGLTGNAHVDLSRRCVVVLCADNGVVAEGVSQSGAEVTPIIARGVVHHTSSVGRMCAVAGVDCVAVDMGMFQPLDEPGLIDRRIAAGTGNIAQGPAMTREQVLAAVRTGVELVASLAQKGYQLIATGEMGIGNTTTATACACALLGLDPAHACGRGAGLSDEGLTHKVEVVRRALAANEPDATDPLDVLAKVGGLDIAGMCGMFLGGAVHRVPVVVDGLISSVAALVAKRLRPECGVAMLGSHLSAEPAARAVMRELGIEPILHARMRLGEGTGAVCMVPLLDMALGLYDQGLSFADFGIESYKGVGQ